jgi:glycosyltransferase involved in cell wall biosynthesis
VAPPAEKLPLVSLVIPSYNHGRYLGAAIESVLAQDYPYVELIVIDDGSTDDSPEILRQYGTRFHWEVQANQGQVATMNRAWNQSRGDILGYLSADDLLLPGAVSASVTCLRQNPDAVLAYCDFNLIDPDGALVRRVRTPEFDYREMVTKMICPPGPGAFFRRTAFEKVGGWHTGFRQNLDYEYWLRLALHGRFVRIPRVLAAYRVHPTSQSFASTSVIRPWEPVQIIESYFASPLVPADLRGTQSQALSMAYLNSGRLHFRMGHYGDGLAALCRAFSLYPRHVLQWRTMRLLVNAFFNRLGHRVLWAIRRSRT